MWLFVFSFRGGKRYSGMTFDSLCIGALVTVGSVLRDADVLSDLSKKGFGAAAWIIYLIAFVFVLSSIARYKPKQDSVHETPEDVRLQLH